MGWCDKLASVPSVGFQFDHHFASGDSILHALAPILDTWVENRKPKFTVGRHESFIVEFTVDDGFNYGVDPSKIWIDFKHRMKIKAASGGPPIVEMLSQPLPYSELLSQVCQRLIAATLLLPDAENRRLTRVGIISTTTVAESEVPPGVARFIKYIGRPWRGQLDHFSCQITGMLDETPAWSDRCIHSLTKPEDKDQLLTLKFDWQRNFTSHRAVTHETLKEILASAEKDANKYFEDLAEGNRFDEELISKAT